MNISSINMHTHMLISKIEHEAKENNSSSPLFSKPHL